MHLKFGVVVELHDARTLHDHLFAVDVNILVHHLFDMQKVIEPRAIEVMDGA